MAERGLNAGRGLVYRGTIEGPGALRNAGGRYLVLQFVASQSLEADGLQDTDTADLHGFGGPLPAWIIRACTLAHNRIIRCLPLSALDI